MLIYGRNQHNIAKQLSFNEKEFTKKKKISFTVRGGREVEKVGKLKPI